MCYYFTSYAGNYDGTYSDPKGKVYSKEELINKIGECQDEHIFFKDKGDIYTNWNLIKSLVEENIIENISNLQKSGIDIFMLTKKGKRIYKKQNSK